MITLAASLNRLPSDSSAATANIVDPLETTTMVNLSWNAPACLREALRAVARTLDAEQAAGGRRRPLFGDLRSWRSLGPGVQGY